MHIIGELKDKKMAQELIRGLRELGIEASLIFSESDDLYILSLASDEFLAQAQDFFRVKMGFKKSIEVDKEWIKIKTLPRGEATYAMVIFCVVIYGLSFTRTGDSLYEAMLMGKVDSSPFYEILHGQIWRLISPIFLHMNFIHVLFNMLWFKDLGYLIEFNFKKNFLILFVLGTGLFSNLFQYLVSGPQFGGMSGVLYALLAFVWVHKKLNPQFEYSIPRFDMGMMVGWFFLCLTGILGPIANTAHGAGLVAGILTAIAYGFKAQKKRFNYLFVALFFLIFTLAVEGYKLSGKYYFYQWINNG